jgi:hypothetical protein
MGIDHVVDDLAARLVALERAYLIDDYAEGKDTGIIDLLLVGNIDPYHLNDLSRNSERYIKRKIRSLVLNRDEYKKFEPKIKSYQVDFTNEQGHVIKILPWEKY